MAVGIFLRHGEPRLRRRRDSHGPRLGREPPALAVVARGDAHQLLEHPADDPALGSPPAVGKQAAEPFELRLRPALRPPALPGELYFFEARAAQPEFFLGGGEVFPRRVEEGAGVELFLRFHVGRHASQKPSQPAWHVAKRAEHTDRPLAERLRWLGDELGGVDAVDVAEALAGRAGALWTVETKELRFRGGIAHAAGCAGVFTGEDQIGRSLPARVFWFTGHDHLAAGGLEGEFHRLRDPASSGVAGHEPIDHHVDRVLDLLLERRRILDAADGAIHAGPCETLADKISEEIAVLALSLADKRRQQHHPLSLAGRDDPLYDLVARLRLKHGVAFGAVGRANPGVEHAEEVVDLRHRGDGGSWVRACRLLRDRDRWRKTGHAVDVRPGQLAQELPRER